ncbi:MAG: FAD-dependent oxidoreductase [Alphaproteobacteria bacterium]|nr:FAD-dependent oxidoreductase [Alphaproteobacteria bacterium]
MQHAVVVGAGLKGIVAARRLVDRGCRVTLVDRAKRLGGVHSSIPWDGFSLDIGCHLFGNEDDATTALLLDLMGGEARPITPAVASVLAGVRTDGIEYPDLTRLPDDRRGAVLAGVLERAAERGDAPVPGIDPTRSLAAHLVDLFGASAADVLGEVFAKMLQAPPGELSAAAYSALPARRLKVTDDATAALLKQVPAFDAVILRSNADDPMRFLRDRASGFEARALYPTTGGMGGFAATATARLMEVGVELTLEAEIASLALHGQTTRLTLADGRTFDADVLVWTSGWTPLASALGEDAASVSAAIRPVPMALFYFDIPAGAAGTYHWVHDFDNDHRVFRASVPSLFGPDTAPDGRHYVCAEVPTAMDSAMFTDPAAQAEAIWAEVTALGVATGPLPERVKTLTTPASYRFPARDFETAVAPVRTRAAAMPGLLVADEFNFGKSGSVREIDQRLAGWEG